MAMSHRQIGYVNVYGMNHYQLGQQENGYVAVSIYNISCHHPLGRWGCFYAQFTA